MKEFGFIGAGHMGYPMLAGAIREFGKEQVAYTSATISRMEEVRAKTGVDYTESIEELLDICRFLVIAVKPGQLKMVLPKMREKLSRDQIVISPVVSTPIEQFKQALGKDARIIRIMPNTAALVGEGMTEICYSPDEYNDSERQMAERLLRSFGRFVEIPENLMDAATCASGSSPAYVYLFIEALADGAVKYGIPRTAAYEMAAQTVLGAAKMVLETGKHPAELKDAVCSPGGTTIEGVSALEEFGFRNSVLKATDACYNKAAGRKA